MLHGNARLTVHGRRLLVRRVIDDRRPIAHVAKEVGVSRQCATRWVKRFRAEGEAGLRDRSSRPRTTPSRTSAEREQAVLAARDRLRQGPARIAAVTGVPARTVSRILGRHHVPPLAWLDPVTGQLIRASRATAERYERDRPGELVHVDVKKLGRIPDGGGWRVSLTEEHRNGDGAAGRRPNPAETVALTEGGLATATTLAPDPNGLRGPRAHAPWRTITVAAITCVDASIAATTALIRGPSAARWLSDLGLPARLVRPDGSVLALSGWPTRRATSET